MNALKRRIYLCVVVIVTIGALAVTAWRGYDVFRPSGKEIASALGYWALGLIACGVVTTLLHELGHALFGVFAKMDVQSIGVLGACLQKKPCGKGYEFTSMENAYAGATGAMPRNPYRAEVKYAVMTAGGLIITALCLVGCALALVFAPQMPLWAYALTGGGLPLVAYAFFVNALPFESNETMTDGAVLCHLKKQSDRGKVLSTILRVQGALFEGKRPREIAESEYYDLPQLPEDDMLFLVLLSLRYVYHADCGQEERAQVVMARIESLITNASPYYAKSLVAERISAAANRGGLVAMESEIKTLQNKTPADYRARALYQLSKGDRAGARAQVEKGLALCDGYRIKGLALYEKDALAAVKRAIPREYEIFRKPKEIMEE